MNVVQWITMEYENRCFIYPFVNQTRAHNAANEILTIAGLNTLVAHDRNGCMTKVPKPNSWSSAYTLVYDAWNRLISVSDGDTLVATYMYDARNHRIKTTVGTTVTLKYFNRDWQEIESVTNNVTTGYVYGLRYVDDIVCRMKNTEVLCALQDPNWNVVALVNTSSTVAERLTYDSFGRVTFRNASFVAKTASSYNWTKTFTGQIYDTETGLMLYRNRYYHPGLGRFITRDPIGYRGDSVNLYRYIGNNPTINVDPRGLNSPWGSSDWVRRPSNREGVSGDTFTISPTFVELQTTNEMDIVNQTDRLAYQVMYNAIQGACSRNDDVKEESITLTQMLNPEGMCGWYTNSYFDSTDKSTDIEANKGRLYPVYIGQGNGSNTLIDAPSGNMWTGDVYKITVCAICTRKFKTEPCRPPVEDILGCVSFTWNAETPHASYDGKEIIYESDTVTVPASVALPNKPAAQGGVEEKWSKACRKWNRGK